jgi:hypothetical protein
MVVGRCVQVPGALTKRMLDVMPLYQNHSNFPFPGQQRLSQCSFRFLAY